MRRFILVGALLLAAAGLYSCGNAFEDEIATEEPSVYLTITAGESSEAVTRTALTGGTGSDRNNVRFKEGDALSVFSTHDTNVEFSMTAGPYSNGSADFSGYVKPYDEPYYVVYPYSSALTADFSGSGATIHAVIPSEQRAVDDSFDPAAALSAGRTSSYTSDESLSVTMKNVCALIKFTVPEGYTFTKAEFDAGFGTWDNTATLAGKTDITIGTDGSVSVSSGCEDFDECVREIVLEGEMTSGHDYYIAVAPKDITSFTFSLYKGNSLFARVSAGEMSLKSGKIVNLGMIDYQPWSGFGTQSKPYLIQSLSDLILLKTALFSLNEDIKRYYFKQTADIDCKGTKMGIGADYSFGGHYDGGGYCISNYKLDGPTAGLFSLISGATIENLQLRPYTDGDGYVLKGNYAGGGCLAGQAEGNCTISNCTLLSGDYKVQFTGSTKYPYFGGLIGKTTASTTITGCKNAGNISIISNAISDGYDHSTAAGGILGFAENIEEDNEPTLNPLPTDVQHIVFDRCRNTGSVSLKDNNHAAYAGGIAGYVRDSGMDQALVPHVSNCVNNGAISAEAADEDLYAYAGGIIGNNGSDGYNSDLPWVHNCLNTGSIYAMGNDASCGGIIGYCYDTDTMVAVCINTGSISADGDPHSGAICGMGTSGGIGTYRGGSCESCYWLDPSDSPATPLLPICYQCSEGGYHYSYIPYTKAEDCIFEDNNYLTVSNTGWTKDEWKTKAAHWTGSATWGGTSNDLDILIDASVQM